MKVDYFNPPKKSTEELDELYNDNLFLIMDEVLEDNKSFTFVFQDLLDILKYGFEVKDIRCRMVKYKFHKEDKEMREMELRHLVSNLIFWKPLMAMDKVDILDESFIFDLSNFSTDSLLDYINEKLLPNNDEDFASKNAMIDDIYHAIISISHAFCLLIGGGVSIYNLKAFEEKYPEVHSIMYDDVDETLSPKEIEDELDARTKRLIDIMVHDVGDDNREDTDFKPLYASKAKIKEAQLREFMIKIGLKADLSGNTIAIMNNGSFLVNGLNKPSLYVINAMSGRKSLIAVKQGMGVPGAYSKKLCQATTGVSTLSTSNEMCDSITPVEYNIKDENMLNLLDGRYYYDKFGEMKYLDVKHNKTSKDLIGKIVRFRSPVTCTCKDGICKYCYGRLFDINKDMFSVGALSALKQSEPASQGVLSTKHSQATHSNEIKFNDEFYEAFDVESSEVVLREDSDLDAELYMVLGEVIEEELDDKMYYYTHSFSIQDATHHTIYTIHEDNDAKLYLTDQIIDQYKKVRDKRTPISLENIDDESSLFMIEVKNKELTEPIKIFQKILNTNDHYGATTISELVQTYGEALISMGQKYDLVHAETIIRALVRKKSNILEFPDFSRAGDPNDWQIVKLNDSLYYNPSAMISMPYGYLRKQLMSPILYEKTAPSHLDTLYVDRLSDYLD